MTKIIEKKYYYIVAMLIIIVDQITKLYFEKLLDYQGNSIPVLGDEFFKFTLVYNKGVAFGIPMGSKWILSGISFIAGSAIIIYLYKLPKIKKMELWAFSFILGGAFGNLVDRFLYGKVIDFLDFDFPDIIMERWPVFNVADSFVSIGMVLLLVYYLFFDKNSQK